MNLVDKAIEMTRATSGKLPTRDSLLVAFFDLEKQLGKEHDTVCDLQRELDTQRQLLGKKDEVITAHEARIRILEERLRLAAVERFAASSEKTPWQIDCFNEAEACSDEVDEHGDEGDEEPDPDIAAKPKPKRKGRKGLSGDIPRV